MDKEEKKKQMSWKVSVKGIIFCIVLGLIVMHGLLSESQRHAYMGGWRGIWAELAGSWFLGLVCLIGAYMTWGMFNMFVLGKDILKEIRT